MTAGARFLAVWLTPALWLQMPALIAGRGPDGLWLALALALAPLVALASRSRAPAPAEAETAFPVAALLLAVGLLLWANLALAGDAAVWLGEPRWRGIATVGAGALLLVAWRGAGRAVPALLLVAALALGPPLLELARVAGVGPRAAWERVATQSAFRFPPSSPWVTEGRDLRLVHGGAALDFEEEHRLTAPVGGRLTALTVDGDRPSETEWALAPGQSVVLRAGDRLQSGSTARVRFEADKQVPGSPPSGMAWAAGNPPDWPRCAGLLVTIVFGAIALGRAGGRISRSEVAWLAGGGLVALFWSQAWAIYSILTSPDLFLGGLTAERLLAFPAPVPESIRSASQSCLLLAGFAGFLASSVALRERIAALDRTGDGAIGRDLGVWAGVFAIAGLAALWPVDGWSIARLGLGAAAASLGAARLVSHRLASPAGAAVAGSLGLIAFAAIAVAGRLRAGDEGWIGAIVAYPALVAVPLATLALRVARATAPRPRPRPRAR